MILVMIPIICSMCFLLFLSCTRKNTSGNGSQHSRIIVQQIPIKRSEESIQPPRDDSPQYSNRTALKPKTTARSNPGQLATTGNPTGTDLSESHASGTAGKWRAPDDTKTADDSGIFSDFTDIEIDARAHISRKATKDFEVKDQDAKMVAADKEKTIYPTKGTVIRNSDIKSTVGPLTKCNTVGTDGLAEKSTFAKNKDIEYETLNYEKEKSKHTIKHQTKQSAKSITQNQNEHPQKSTTAPSLTIHSTGQELFPTLPKSEI